MSFDVQLNTIHDQLTQLEASALNKQPEERQVELIKIASKFNTLIGNQSEMTPERMIGTQVVMNKLSSLNDTFIDLSPLDQATKKILKAYDTHTPGILGINAAIQESAMKIKQ